MHPSSGLHRALLHGHAHDDEGEGGGEDTQDVRIAAIFVILVAGLVGGLIPVFVKVRIIRMMLGWMPLDLHASRTRMLGFG